MVNFSWSSLFSIGFSLFLLMDPIGNIPLYVSILKDIDPARQRKIIFRELLIALCIIILFSFLGNYILQLLHVSQETIMISGGLILFLIAIRMIFPNGGSGSNLYPSEQGEPFIVPLAVPLVAGPSVLAAVMIYANHESHLTMVGSIISAWIVTFLILIGSPFLKKILGVRCIAAGERLMGLLLTLIAVQMFIEGVAPLIQH
ncbi:MarC family protein [Simkania negevensis]|uniref:UPF0056 inner membrane protein n=1 Tax=Simkania negevensis (strain ATCC VR-1471 / DSM 27360 / Z) TaxID=331113 RepID=F8L9W2_SIMNZ|nr:MarC family protein [Simkania negevensis]CCB89668.1 UPF0056 inner membrane protein yhgN [Simkania negevensis Z]